MAHRPGLWPWCIFDTGASITNHVHNMTQQSSIEEVSGELQSVLPEWNPHLRHHSNKPMLGLLLPTSDTAAPHGSPRLQQCKLDGRPLLMCAQQPWLLMPPKESEVQLELHTHSTAAQICSVHPGWHCSHASAQFLSSKRLVLVNEPTWSPQRARCPVGQRVWHLLW